MKNLGIPFECHVTTMKNLPRDKIIMEAPHPIIFNIHSFIPSFILRISFHKNSKYFFLSTRVLIVHRRPILRCWSSLFIKLISNSTFKCHTFMICVYVMCAMSTFFECVLNRRNLSLDFDVAFYYKHSHIYIYTVTNIHKM